MASKNKCKVCGTRANFGYSKDDKELFCKTHRKPTMINVKNKLCLYENCKRDPSYGFSSDRKRIFCKEHKKPEMIDLKSKKCEYESGCLERPLYNFKGESKAIFCNEHKHKDMINVLSRLCQFENCEKIPSYNFDTEIKAIFCKKHKQSGMVDISSKKCQFIGCSTQANYNIKGEKIALFCVEHKDSLMINVKSKTCKVQDCIKQPNFNHKGEKVGIFCSDHKESEMVNVKHKTCQFQGCEKFPNFNYEKESIGIFCSNHKEPNMVDLKHLKCKSENCKTVAIYGYIGQELSYCGNHANKLNYKGLYKNPNKLCDNCENVSTYGIKEPMHCEEHAKVDEICLIIQTCTVCHKENEIVNKEGLCITYCQPDKQYHQIKHEKKKEKKVLKYLDDNLETDYKIQDDRTIDTSCNRKRPDRIYDCNTHFVIVEIDENQHKGYSKEENCELVRMHQIYEALGLPCIFLRFNPDNFKVSGKLVKTNITTRLEQLTVWLQHCFDFKEPKGILYKFLYYDNFDETDKSFLAVDDIKLITTPRT